MRAPPRGDVEAERFVATATRPGTTCPYSTDAVRDGAQVDNLAVIFQQGGAGKITLAVNLAVATELENAATVLVDHDLDERGFLASDITQDAVIRNFEVIGEASRDLERHCPKFAAAQSERSLMIAYEMRNTLARGYFRVDLEIVWKALRNDLPGLRRQVETLLKALETKDPPRPTP